MKVFSTFHIPHWSPLDLTKANLKGIEQGQAVDMLTERLHQRQVEKEELETQLAIENNKKICLSEAQILAFLDYVCEMPLDDIEEAFEGENTETEGCSSMMTPAPPKAPQFWYKAYQGCGA